MAEFCLKCFNELNDTNYTGSEVWLVEDFCEGCVDWKPCIMKLYPKLFFYRFIDWVRGHGEE